mgnify:CR=1 FL=1
MKLTSLDISPAAKIDKKFTCDGRGISPALAWSDFPATTKSFALVMSDPDAPGGTYLHWLVCNIPVDKNFLSQNELLAPPAIALANSSGETSTFLPAHHPALIATSLISTLLMWKIWKMSVQKTFLGK